MQVDAVGVLLISHQIEHTIIMEAEVTFNVFSVHDCG